METVRLFDFDFHSAHNCDKILAYLSDWTLQEGQLPVLITPNVDQIVKFNREENKGLKARLQNAALVLPDGQPLIWSSKLKKGSALKSRLTGSDLFPILWSQFQNEGKRVFFILPRKSLGEEFEKQYDNCAFYSPPFFSLTNGEEYQAVLEECILAIRRFSPEHVMIGLGFPKQERLALDLIDEFHKEKIFYHLLGASFEFYHGKKKRAPKWMQKAGLEFLHRMIMEPGRMIKRYLIEDLAFIPLLIKELRSPKI
ncbi:MAG: WecB/TagA/CpsF family glycosyltransferase [Flavobacteriales bacterium]|nr:WecB/TagA/CpsF family glycosyltransferase [Flavobacteriales bacterium]